MLRFVDAKIREASEQQLLEWYEFIKNRETLKGLSKQGAYIKAKIEEQLWSDHRL